jgi:hypothetical protein
MPPTDQNENLRNLRLYPNYVTRQVSFKSHERLHHDKAAKIFPKFSTSLAGQKVSAQGSILGLPNTPLLSPVPMYYTALYSAGCELAQGSAFRVPINTFQSLSVNPKNPNNCVENM